MKAYGVGVTTKKVDTGEIYSQYQKFDVNFNKSALLATLTRILFNGSPAAFDPALTND